MLEQLKIYSTEKLNLIDLIRRSAESITIKAYRRVNGKLAYQDVTIRLDQLSPQMMYDCRLMVSYLCEAHHRSKNNQFVPIPKQTLAAMFGNDYKNIVNILEAVGVIIVNPYFRFGNNQAFCKSYAITNQYHGNLTVAEVSDEFIKYRKAISATSFGNLEFTNVPGCIVGGQRSDTVSSNGTVVSLVDGHQNRTNRTTNTNTEGFPNIDTTPPMIQQQTGAIPDPVQPTSEQSPPMIQQQGGSIQELDGYHQLINYMHQSIAGLKIVNKVRIKHSQHCGRLSHIVNRLKSTHRYKIKDQYGREMVMIDYSTSNLQHLLVWLRGTEGIDPDELSRFKVSLLEQDFYNTLFTENITRDKKRNYVMCWLASSHERWKMVQRLRDYFPTITAFIDQRNTVEGVKTTNTLLNALMRSESFLVHSIMLYLIREYPQVQVFSIHDCLLVDQHHAVVAHNLMQVMSNQYFGFGARMKATYNNSQKEAIEFRTSAPLRFEARIPAAIGVAAIQPVPTVQDVLHINTNINMSGFEEYLREERDILRGILGEEMKKNQMHYRIEGDKVKIYLSNPEKAVAFDKTDYMNMIQFVRNFNVKILQSQLQQLRRAMKKNDKVIRVF